METTIKAVVNPITRFATILVTEKSCEYEYKLSFEDLDSWNTFKHKEGQIYDVHFHYDEQMWFHIYKTENYEDAINFEIEYIYSDKQ
jgi:hypothetical protein